MKYFFVFLILTTLAFSQKSQPVQKSHICYFSLNNEKEFEVMDKFTEKLNSFSSNKKITVREYLTKGESPEDAFKKMITSGQKCDGLVISGHHTGGWGGKRASGSLGIKFLETLSCNPKYKDWFSHIKALWLQGCRTLGVDKIEAIDDADYHTQRVGNVLDADHLEQSFADLNMEFSATLDQDNPLSSRYLRIFPQADVFGWTKTAPGEKSHSEYSIPYHIANMTKHMNDRKRYFEDPTKNVSPETAVKYFNMINNMLTAGSRARQECGISQAAISGWIDHGNSQSNSYAFNNPDLNAYPALSSGGNPLLEKAKNLDCLLKNANSPKEALEVIKTIASDERLLGYSFNAIWEVLQSYKREGRFDQLETLQKELKGLPNLMNFMMRKLQSKELGIIQKINYYGFYRYLTGEDYDNINKAIRKSAKKILIKDSQDNYDLRDYQETLWKILTKNNLLTDDYLKKLVNSSTVSSNILSQIARTIGQSEIPIENASRLLEKIIDSPKSDDFTLGSVTHAIHYSKTPIKNASGLLEKIIDSPKSDNDSLRDVARAIGQSRIPIENASGLLEKIINSPKTDDSSLGRVASTIGHSNTPIENASGLLEKIINSSKSNYFSLGKVARAIGQSRTPIKNASELLEKIIDSPKSDNDSLSDVAISIGHSHTPIKNASELLEKIIDSPQSDNYILRYVADAIGQSKIPIDNALVLFEKIIYSPKSNNHTLKEITPIIQDSQIPPSEVKKLLQKIDHKRELLNP